VERLTEHEGALVGEVGLCKCAKSLRGPLKASNWAKQLTVCESQLGIAAAMGRVVSLHCVKVSRPHPSALFLGHTTIPRPQRVLCAGAYRTI
jgi:Tat protein secretion system quality control protein TatD with DNase activity